MSECCEPRTSGDGYDVIVIGAGSAGFSAAITAVEAGAKVLLVGHGTIGGTCVNVGCVPSKALIRAAEAVHHAHAAGRFAGISGSARLDDWAALKAQKDDLVAGLRQAKYVDVLPAYKNLEYREGPARLVDGGVEVGGERVSAERIVIATGSRERVPDIAGLNGVDWLTSTSAFELDALPKSMIIMGAGYIGCELAQMFARLGVEVTVVFRSRLLPGSEPEISTALAEVFASEGIRLTQVKRYVEAARDKTSTRLTVELADGGEDVLVGERLLLATGRIANTDGLALAEAGIATDERGAIIVDERMRTSKPGVYAAGDVTGRDQYVYMAAYGARIAAANALDSNALAYDNSAMPAVTFTDPQVASVGLTEAEAAKAGVKVRTSLLTLDNVPRALAARDTRGLIKLVAETDSGRLIGAHVLAAEGGDTIQTAALAIAQGLTYEDLGAMIFPYLTMVEGLKLAAQTFDKDVKQLSCCAG